MMFVSLVQAAAGNERSLPMRFHTVGPNDSDAPKPPKSSDAGLNDPDALPPAQRSDVGPNDPDAPPPTK
jgi:hypothetical protein